MGKRSFPTADILASMHGLAGIILVKEDCSIKEAFNKLRTITPQIANFKIADEIDHPTWLKMSKALRPTLKDALPHLAQKTVPSEHFWRVLDPGSEEFPQKIQELSDWIQTMENEFGETQEVPKIKKAFKSQLRYDL